MALPFTFQRIMNVRGKIFNYFHKFIATKKSHPICFTYDVGEVENTVVITTPESVLHHK